MKNAITVVKTSKAETLLQAALTGAQSAFSGLRSAIDQAVTEGLAVGKTPIEKKAALVAWAHATAEKLGMKNAYSTVRVYIAQLAAVAVAPKGLSVKVESGPAGKKSTVALSRNNMATTRDLTKLAEAANAAIGVKPRGASGGRKARLPVAPAIDSVTDTASVIHKMAEESAARERQFISMLLQAVSGETQHKHLRAVVDSALWGIGLRIAARAVEEVAPVETAPIVPMSRGQRAALTRRMNTAQSTIKANQGRAMHAK